MLMNRRPLPRIRKFTISVLVLAALAGYWNFHVYQKTEFLKKFSQPFVTACRQAAGCVTAPSGWQPNGKGGYEKDLMEYEGTPVGFTLRWHIGTDVFLVATAGKDRELKIVRVVD